MFDNLSNSYLPSYRVELNSAVVLSEITTTTANFHCYFYHYNLELLQYSNTVLLAPIYSETIVFVQAFIIWYWLLGILYPSVVLKNP